MIIAKINPPVIASTQVSPFSSLTVSCEYMATIAYEYRPDSPETNFKVMFGYLIYEDEENPTKLTGFRTRYETILTLTSSELSNWGTNDEVMVSAVATKSGVSVTEFIQTDIYIQFSV
jgi:hypothetical protein